MLPGTPLAEAGGEATRFTGAPWTARSASFTGPLDEIDPAILLLLS